MIMVTLLSNKADYERDYDSKPLSALQFNCAERSVKMIESWLAISITQLLPIQDNCKLSFLQFALKKASDQNEKHNYPAYPLHPVGPGLPLATAQECLQEHFHTA